VGSRFQPGQLVRCIRLSSDTTPDLFCCEGMEGRVLEINTTGEVDAATGNEWNCLVFHEKGIGAVYYQDWELEPLSPPLTDTAQTAVSNANPNFLVVFP
jgi:hypothetical protein